MWITKILKINLTLKIFLRKKRLHDSKFWVKNGELLVDYINQTDDRRKAFLIGKVFSYCIECEIDENIFLILPLKLINPITMI